MAKSKNWEEIAENAQQDLDSDAELDLTDALSDLASQDLEEQEELLQHEISDLKELQVAMKLAEQKASENWDKMLHAIAELENTRRRAERDIENAHKYSLEKFSRELIPVIDSLEQALEACSKQGPDAIAQISEGIELTLKMFKGALDKFSISQLNPIGEDFNPNFHEAMTTIEDPKVAPGTVIEVFQKGYKLNDRIIRPARVVVSK